MRVCTKVGERSSGCGTCRAEAAMQVHQDSGRWARRPCNGVWGAGTIKWQPCQPASFSANRSIGHSSVQRPETDASCDWPDSTGHAGSRKPDVVEHANNVYMPVMPLDRHLPVCGWLAGSA